MTDAKPAPALAGALAGAGVAAGGGERLLDPAFVARLDRLALRTRRPLAGLYAGGHRSTRHGASIDFADYREYHPGDDFRRIDYHVLARFGVLVLKLFDAEEDLTVRLVLDTSASMGPDRKLHTACQLAAALGYVALARRDAVRVHALGAHGARFNGREAVPALFARLSGLQAGGPTDFPRLVGELLGRPGPRGLTILLSDLLTPDWADVLRRLPSAGGELAVAHVLAPDELEPSFSGDVDLVDAETGRRTPVSLSAEVVRRYTSRALAWREEVGALCARRGIAYVPAVAGMAVEPVLTESWRRAGVLR